LDPNTLTFYLIAAGLSFGLALVLVTFAQIQAGTLLIRSTALVFLLLAIAFFAAGYGPLLPRWMTVMGTNLLILLAGILLYAGLRAHHTQQPATLDRLGLGVLVASAVPFWYWGLVEPNGIYRSQVFSFAAAMINVRSALLLLRRNGFRRRKLPALALGGVFAVIAGWMLLRGILLFGAEPLPIEQRGSNPTTWLTVFWYNVIVSLMAACVLWLEIDRLKGQYRDRDHARGQAKTAAAPSLDPARGNLILLWSMVAVLCIALVSEVGIAYGRLYEQEHERLMEKTRQSNNTFVEHTAQVINHVDMLLRAVRGYHERVWDVPDTERFVASLQFRRDLIEDIYLISAEGLILTPWADRAKELSVAQRDYFLFHRQQVEDLIFIGPVVTGVVTGKQQFRLSRRINHPDGSFAGVIVAPLEPQAFSHYYRQFVVDGESIATLVGSDDRKIRARIPETALDKWETPVESPLWAALANNPEGSYRNKSFIDGVERQFIYRRVGELPLVMITAFSATDIHSRAQESIRPIAYGTLLVLIVILALAAMLTASIRRRDEQDSLIAMLSHELKTPLSVIRMTLGGMQLPDASQQRIARSVSAMNDLVERCVQADRLHHDLVPLNLAKIQLAEFLAAQVTASAAPEKIVLTVDTLSACLTDPQLLQVILGNLIDNALKYGAVNQPVSITAKPGTRRPAGGRPGIRIAIANAPGPAGQPDAAHLFRKYYRAASAHGKTGSGLGLYISAGFARKLGGELRYLPTTDTVRFELWIPL